MRRHSLLFVLVAVVLFTACPGNKEDVSQNTPPKTSTTTSDAQTSTADITTLNVELTEYEIRMPDRVTVGRRTFAIVNQGKEKHSFKIIGNGLDIGMTEPLSRGDTGQITVALTPGTYSIICPVEGHKDKGMSRTLTVR